MAFSNDDSAKYAEKEIPPVSNDSDNSTLKQIEIGPLGCQITIKSLSTTQILIHLISNTEDPILDKGWLLLGQPPRLKLPLRQGEGGGEEGDNLKRKGERINKWKKENADKWMTPLHYSQNSNWEL